MRLIDRLHNPESKYTVWGILQWLWAAWRGNRLQAVLNASLGLTGVAVGLASVWAMQRAIDIAAGSREGSLWLTVALLGMLMIGEFVLRMFRLWLRNILGVKAQNRMQQQVLSRLLRSEWQSRSVRHSGDVINRLEQDVQEVVVFLTETMPSTLSTVAMFVGAFLYLLHLDVWLACITVCILPFFVLLSRYYMKRMRQLSRLVRQSDSQVQSQLTEAVQHHMLIKTFEAEDWTLGRLDATQSELRGNVRQRTVFSIASNFVIQLGFALSYLIAFLWGAVRLMSHTITFGQMTAFLQLVSRIQGPARDLTRLAPAFVSVFTAAERLMELEEVPLERQGQPQLLQAPCGLRFHDVSYAYDDTPQGEQISYADCDFKPGTCTAILGETGSGKTTMIRLLLALMKPKQGRITIYAGGSGEEELSPLHRCNFVYVPQGNTLMSGTIRENLRLGRDEATDDDMKKALTMACADFVNALPEGLDTPVSESGGGLSEGQCQRLAIARALLRSGSIMLLDEATSALDPDTERRLLDNLLNEHRHTIIFVTHRRTVVDYCDQTITVSA